MNIKPWKKSGSLKKFLSHTCGWVGRCSHTCEIKDWNLIDTLSKDRLTFLPYTWTLKPNLTVPPTPSNISPLAFCIRNLLDHLWFLSSSHFPQIMHTQALFILPLKCLPLYLNSFAIIWALRNTHSSSCHCFLIRLTGLLFLDLIFQNNLHVIIGDISFSFMTMKYFIV